ncbi:MAG: diphthine synthase [Candidatus Diapherotrites archaeon]|nr:diphthine synthase [Candidatus Diapherotrites archaeon]
MFYLIGIGLKPAHLTIEALNKIKECEVIYLETYTCLYAEGTVQDLEKIIGKKIIPLNRTQVEENFVEQNLKLAKERNIALLVFGNALTATTHTQLLVDCKKQGIKFEVFAGISVTDFLGKTGLNIYKFGRSVTLVLPEKNYEPESFYDQILKNQEQELHTLCFLDIKEGNRLMTVKEGIQVLEKIETKREQKILNQITFIGLSKAGSQDEKIMWGNLEEMKQAKLDTPAFLVVCSKLSDFEKEALEKLFNKPTLGTIFKGWTGK